MIKLFRFNKNQWINFFKENKISHNFEQTDIDVPLGKCRTYGGEEVYFIFIRNDISPFFQVIVFIHELLHVFEFKTGLRFNDEVLLWLQKILKRKGEK